MNEQPSTLPPTSFPPYAGRLIGTRPVVIRGLAMTAAGALLLLIGGRNMLATREPSHGAIATVAGVALLISGVRTLRRIVDLIKLQVVERRALRKLQRKLHPDWGFRATFFQDAPIAVITSPAGATWNVIIRCFARTQVERSFFGLGARMLSVLGDSVNATSLLAATYSVAHGGYPLIWYPGSSGTREVFGGAVPIVSGDADKLLFACGARRDGLVKGLVKSLRRDQKESRPEEPR